MTSLHSLRSNESHHSNDSISTTISSGDGQFGHFKLADVPKLEAIFLAVFDTKIGPVIKHQVVADHNIRLDTNEVREVVTTSDFSSFSAAIIPKPELFNRLIKLNLDKYKVMGHPIKLSNMQKYHRANLMFNFCFVVAKEPKVDCMYEPLVQKCGEYFMELEQDSFFISNPETCQRIPDLMRAILKDLNAKGECVLPVDGTATTMYLKLCPAYRGIEPPTVKYYMVPMFIRQLDFTRDSNIIDKMDVLSQKIIPRIDGVKCVKEIATEADIDPDLVSRCIRNLYFYECVNMVPLFLYSNTYVATEKLHDFYCNPTQIEDCLEFVRVCKENNEKGPIPLFSDVFRLYMSLRCGINLREWCELLKPQIFNVDERRLIQFGMHQNFLRKLSLYPVATVNTSCSGEIYQRCDGTHALEDLAVIYGVKPDELYTLLKGSNKFEFVSK